MRPAHRTIRTAAIALIAVLAATHASASVIYTYIGNDFTQISVLGTPPDPHTTSDNLTGFVELMAALAPNLNDSNVTPVSFEFSDGVSTFTNVNATSTDFSFSTDGNGNIVEWTVVVSANVVPTTGGGIIAGFRTEDDNDPIDPDEVDFGSKLQCGPLSTPIFCDPVGSYSSSGVVHDNPGTWQQQATAVPEPSTLLLVIGGAVVASSRRLLTRRRSSPEKPR